MEIRLLMGSSGCLLSRALISARSVVVDRPAVELGLGLLDADGDFADGVIAMAGSALLERWGQKVVTL